MGKAVAHRADAYTPVCEIASGGMGRVDLALRQEGAFRRLYAIKRLHPHLRDDESFRTMFLEEARIAGLIQHPNVVSVLDVGQDADGPFLVMDFIEGLAVSVVCRLARRREGRLPIQVCLRITLQIAAGLHAAHELRTPEGEALSVVHRDLNPQNVLVGYDGTVRITDFGIARAMGRQVQTSTGILKGKMAYMAPEQLRFEKPDRRSDLFALGVMLYEMLAGRRLYRPSDEETSDVARRILHEPPPDIGEVRQEVPPSLVQLLFELLAKDPGSRPDSAAVVSEALEMVLHDRLADEPPEPVAPYIQGLAGELRDKQREAVRAALASETARVEPLHVVVEAGTAARDSEPSSSAVVATRDAAPARRPRWKRLAIAIVPVLGLLGLGGYWWMQAGDPEPSPPPADAAAGEMAADRPPQSTPAAGEPAAATDDRKGSGDGDEARSQRAQDDAPAQPAEERVDTEVVEPDDAASASERAAERRAREARRRRWRHRRPRAGSTKQPEPNEPDPASDIQWESWE